MLSLKKFYSKLRKKTKKVNHESAWSTSAQQRKLPSLRESCKFAFWYFRLVGLELDPECPWLAWKTYFVLRVLITVAVMSAVCYLARYSIIYIKEEIPRGGRLFFTMPFHIYMLTNLGITFVYPVLVIYHVRIRQWFKQAFAVSAEDHLLGHNAAMLKNVRFRSLKLLVLSPLLPLLLLCTHSIFQGSEMLLNSFGIFISRRNGSKTSGIRIEGAIWTNRLAFCLRREGVFAFVSGPLACASLRLFSLCCHLLEKNMECLMIRSKFSGDLDSCSDVNTQQDNVTCNDVLYSDKEINDGGSSVFWTIRTHRKLCHLVDRFNWAMSTFALFVIFLQLVLIVVFIRLLGLDSPLEMCFFVYLGLVTVLTTLFYFINSGSAPNRLLKKSMKFAFFQIRNPEPGHPTTTCEWEQASLDLYLRQMAFKCIAISAGGIFEFQKDLLLTICGQIVTFSILLYGQWNTFALANIKEPQPTRVIPAAKKYFPTLYPGQEF